MTLADLEKLEARYAEEEECIDCGSYFVTRFPDMAKALREAWDALERLGVAQAIQSVSPVQEGKEMNKYIDRVTLFLHAHGLSTSDIARTSDGEIARVTINGHTNMWTIHYGQWASRLREQWAAGLGFKKCWFRGASECATLAGHTEEELNAWIASRMELKP